MDAIDRIIEMHQGKPNSLIQVLLEIQSENHWLPREALDRVSQKLQVPLSKIMQIVTFYKTFSLIPKGRHEIHVCTGSSCNVRGSADLLDALQESLGIRPGQTGSDSKFSLETSACLGCCNLAPEIIINGRHHGRMTPEKAKEALKECE
jgi:NADH-quinone oxidoreductase subunit E